MTKTVLLTSTSAFARGFNYRLDNKQLAHFDMPAYALNVPVDFPSEEAYASFKHQAAKYFDGEFPVLIEGKAAAGKAEKINEKAEKARAADINDKAQKATKPVIDATKDSGVKINIGIETGVESK